MFRNPEYNLFEPTPYVYPRGYFQVQVLAAERIFQLGFSPNLQSAILNYTVIYRHLVGHNPSRKGPDPKWIEFVRGLSKDGDITGQTWQFYTRQPHSIYHPEIISDDNQHFGGFIQKLAIDKSTGDQKVELHFSNQRRGQPKSDFSRIYVKERTQDLTNLFQSVKLRMESDGTYHPKWVTLVSWMNNFPGVRVTLPNSFVESETIVRPPDLNFRSNSLWGQF